MNQNIFLRRRPAASRTHPIEAPIAATEAYNIGIEVNTRRQNRHVREQEATPANRKTLKAYNKGIEVDAPRHNRQKLVLVATPGQQPCRTHHLGASIAATEAYNIGIEVDAPRLNRHKRPPMATPASSHAELTP